MAGLLQISITGSGPLHCSAGGLYTIDTSVTVKRRGKQRFSYSRFSARVSAHHALHYYALCLQLSGAGTVAALSSLQAW